MLQPAEAGPTSSRSGSAVLRRLHMTKVTISINTEDSTRDRRLRLLFSWHHASHSTQGSSTCPANSEIATEANQAQHHAHFCDVDLALPSIRSWSHNEPHMIIVVKFSRAKATALAPLFDQLHSQL